MDQFKEAENKKEFTFDLEIFDNGSFTMDFDGKPKTFGDQKISCILTKTEPVVKPKTWKIVKNEDLKGKHLLVFHLLPPKATGMYKEGGFKQLKDNPTCDLFIRFVILYNFFLNPIIFIFLEEARLRTSFCPGSDINYGYYNNNNRNNISYQ